MRICLVLHFYQPHDQQPDILHRIVNECYLPLLSGLSRIDGYAITCNFAGSLLELLAKHHYKEVLSKISELVSVGKIELTGSAAYHPILPLLPKDEIIRQINLHEYICQKYLKTSAGPSGFFSPELAVSPKLLKYIATMGYKWIVCDSSSFPRDKTIQKGTIYYDKGSKICTFFRNATASNILLSAQAHDPQDFVKLTGPYLSESPYGVLVLDAETFGHHRVGYDKFLHELLLTADFEFVSLSGILADGDMKKSYISINPSTWVNNEQKPFVKENSFVLWKNPSNPIHRLQWRLLGYVAKLVSSYKLARESNYVRGRKLLDKAISSDQFWWASGEPWWSLEMIESGAFNLLQVVLILFSKNSPEYKRSLSYYRSILDKAFFWQRSGYIRKKHISSSATYLKQPFKERVPVDWGNLLILELEEAMETAAAKKDFELAIKWRDALIKIKNKTDIYDIKHVIDELWSYLGTKRSRPFFERSWESFSDFIKPFLIGVDSKESFEYQKKVHQSKTKV